MYLVGTSGQGWQRSLGKLLAIVVLLAVPTLALTHLGAAFSPAWQDRGSDEAALAGGESFALNAPTATLRQQQHANAASNLTKATAEPALLAEDWRFTAQPTALTPSINNMIATLIHKEFISDQMLARQGVPPNALFLIQLQQYNANKLLLNDLNALSKITSPQSLLMINADVGNLVVREAVFNIFFQSMGASPALMQMVLTQELAFNEVSTQNMVSTAQQALTPTPTPTPPVPVSASL